ncbi:MAG: elongation factor G [Nitriliruptor sp.]|nr:MAG: elongation factor G [Nitriliruptor sp.]
MGEKAVPTENVRNVLVLGHTGTGKSTLIEAMLAATGHTAAHGEGCPTVDHEPEERERGNSLSLALASCTFEGVKLNLLDAPGGAEALGDAYPALLAADTALFVIDATVGLQPQDEQLWRACDEWGIPRVVFLNKFDVDRARYQATIDQLREYYGKVVAPVHLPLHSSEGITGVVDLLHCCVVDFPGGRRCDAELEDEALRETANANREALIESVVENDDELLERYLEGDTPSAEEISEVFAHGIAESGFVPVLCGAAAEGHGVELLLHFLVEESPSPAEAPHPLPHDGPTVLYVAKTFSDQYVGRINLLRVLSGSLHSDDELVCTRTGERERLHALFSLRGREQLPVDGANAGDIVAVAKLQDVATGDLLTPDGVAPDLALPSAPPGFHRVSLEPVSAGDDDKLSIALQRVRAEDPSIGTAIDETAGIRTFSFAGPIHVDTTIGRMRRKYGVEVEAQPAPVSYLETIRRRASGIGKHVKQTGGHGQFGVAHIRIEPLPRGEDFHFEDAVVGGAIPRGLIPSVEKGVREAMRTGPLAGYPVVDVGVTLFDGKHHSVDSSDAAFQMAGILAFRDAVAQAEPILLEPHVALELTIPDEQTGAVMADLSSRRGRILGTDTTADSRTLVRAQAPEAELSTFAAEYRALTGGRGELTMAYSHHEEAPEAITRRLLEQREPANA